MWPLHLHAWWGIQNSIKSLNRKMIVKQIMKILTRYLHVREEWTNYRLCFHNCIKICISLHLFWVSDRFRVQVHRVWVKFQIGKIYFVRFRVNIFFRVRIVLISAKKHDSKKWSFEVGFTFLLKHYLFRFASYSENNSILKFTVVNTIIWISYELGVIFVFLSTYNCLKFSF